MAAFTAIALAASAVISTGVSVAGASKANKRAKAAKKAIDSYQRQELVNYAALQGPSGKEEEIMSAQVQQSAADQVNAVSQYGSRGMGMVSQISENADLQTQQIAARLESKQDEYKRYAAEGAMRVQETQEVREREDLAGLGQMYNTARQERSGYIMGAANGLMNLGVMAGGMKFGGGGNTNSSAGGSSPSTPVSTYGVVPTQQSLTAGMVNNVNQYRPGLSAEAKQYMAGFNYEQILSNS